MTVRLKTLANRPKRDILREIAYRGRPARTLAGSHVADMAVLRKAICLCDFCMHKWGDYQRQGYRRRKPAPGHATAHGKCDGCKQSMPCGLYLPEELCQ